MEQSKGTHMRLLLIFLLALGPLTLAGEAKDKDKHRGTGPEKHNEDHDPGAIQVYFRPADVVVINRYYSTQPLPPGLQKKLARQGTLPPGWQKRYRPFPASIESQLPPICNTCARGYYDDYAVVFDKRTAIIYDIAQLTVDIVRR